MSPTEQHGITTIANFEVKQKDTLVPIPADWILEKALLIMEQLVLDMDKKEHKE